jgi:1-deoxy-D-xylulose-5-phosphate reductoisomerase
MKDVIILGSTGSIGLSTLKVVRALRPQLRVVGLAANRDYETVLEQAGEFGVAAVAIADEAAAARCSREAPAGMRVLGGADGVEALAGMDADVVVCAVVGMAGLRPVLAAARKGHTIALATKEVLVAAGSIVTTICAEHGARILPVDSEHSAIFQCLGGANDVSRDVKRLLLTASGGPFFDRSDVDFDRVTVEQALAHPRWNMGQKVTVDSATLMNKGLEIMEAQWLFATPVEAIDVVIHPESIVHSLVEFVDGTLLAQLCLPDMRFAIQYALTHPDRVDGDLPALELSALGALHFREPDIERFPCLGLAREAARTGGTMPAVLNAANEVAVEKFLARDIPFSGISRIVEAVMGRHDCVAAAALDDVMAADQWARAAGAEAC